MAGKRKTRREKLSNALLDSLVDLVSKGRVITDNNGFPIIDEKTGEVGRRPPSAADLKVALDYLRESRNTADPDQKGRSVSEMMTAMRHNSALCANGESQ